MTADRPFDNVPDYQADSMMGAAHAEPGEQHDARGLVLAILLCMGCWAALGFVLLS